MQHDIAERKADLGKVVLGLQRRFPLLEHTNDGVIHRFTSPDGREAIRAHATNYGQGPVLVVRNYDAGRPTGRVADQDIARVFAQIEPKMRRLSDCQRTPEAAYIAAGDFQAASHFEIRYETSIPATVFEPSAPRGENAAPQL